MSSLSCIRAAIGRNRVRVAAALTLAAAACTQTPEATPDLAPQRAERGADRGSHLGRHFAERFPRRPRVAATAAAILPVVWTTPYGHGLTQAPRVHPERSVEGRELLYWVLGDGPETVLLLGGIHGDERSSAEAAYDLLAVAVADPAALAGITLVLAPEVNPDGNAARSRRNARDVDLNRNFPSRNWRGDSSAHGPGTHPASEPETRFVLALLRMHAPTRVIATHAAAACVNWDGPAEALAERMSRECGLPVEATIGYPTPGSLGSYLGVDLAVPTITFELATKEEVGAALDGVRRALLVGLLPDPENPPPALPFAGLSEPPAR
ncbi:MAG: murein peptide amidase A [Planctomycetes bacterium]|nr:murein peptide amidase A [Planctomycetota bacterium]